MTFAEDTSIERLRPGWFAATLHERWQSLVEIHGGYAAAVVVRAIETAIGDPERKLRTIAVQFAAAPKPGPVEIEVTVERSGRSLTTTSSRLWQGGNVILVTHAVSSPDWPGMDYSEHLRPAAASPGNAPPFASSGNVKHFANADIRLDPRTTPFSGSTEAMIAAWIRPHGGEPIDAAWVVAMCDLLPPAIFSRVTAPVRAASIEYTVHLAAGSPSLPSGEFVYLSCRSTFASEGFGVEDGAMWGPDGRVLALARQTRLAGV